jgi:ribosomal protein S14
MTDILTDLAEATPEQIAEIMAIMGMAEATPTVEEPKAVSSAKIRCKVCGFHKKPRKVLRETGICGVCTEAVKDGDVDSVEVVGRMGKRGRNSVSVVIDGKRYKVKRLSSRHSERVAAKYASKGKGYAKRAKRTGSAPKGLPTDSRIGADREQRTHES